MIKLNNPVSILESAINRLYPNIDCDICFVYELHNQTKAWGETCWFDDGKKPLIQVEVEIPLYGFIEVIAHEVAHVVAGKDAGHGEKWESAFSAIKDEFNLHYSQGGADDGI